MCLPASACCVGGQGCQGICLSNNRYSLNSCVSYQFNTQTFVILHSFWSQESQSSWAGQLWSGVSHGGFQRELTHNCSVWRPGWHWRIHFQDGSLTAVSRHLHSLLAPSRRLWLLSSSWVSSQHQRFTSRWEQAGSYSASMIPSLKSPPQTSAFPSHLKLVLSTLKRRGVSPTYWREAFNEVFVDILEELPSEAARSG